MTTLTTAPATTRTRTTAPSRPAPIAPAATTTARPHEAADLHDVAALLAAPITGPAERDRYDRALALLLSAEGADASTLIPTARTSDVARHRIAGRALARLSGSRVAHRHLLAGALAILRA